MTSFESNKIHSTMLKLNTKNPFRNQANIADPPMRACEIPIDRRSSTIAQLSQVQDVINSLEYNFLPTTFFCLEKNRPYSRIVGGVALWLTSEMKDVERFPMSFKSRANGQTYRHIVLVVRNRGLHGALGLSRSPLLMFKPVTFRSVVDLVEEFFQCYKQVGHQLVSFKLGLAVSHDITSKVVPCWRFLSLGIQHPVQSIKDCLKTTQVVENFELLLPVLSEQYNKINNAVLSGENTPYGAASVSTPTAVHPGGTLSGTLSGAGGLNRLLNGTLTSLPAGTKPTSAPTIDAGEDDDAASDTDENQRRITCVVNMKSPFVAEGSSGDGSKFSTRFRKTVQEGLNGSLRSRSVPNRRVSDSKSLLTEAAARSERDTVKGNSPIANEDEGAPLCCPAPTTPVMEAAGLVMRSDVRGCSSGNAAPQSVVSMGLTLDNPISLHSLMQTPNFPEMEDFGSSLHVLHPPFGTGGTPPPGHPVAAKPPLPVKPSTTGAKRERENSQSRRASESCQPPARNASGGSAGRSRSNSTHASAKESQSNRLIDFYEKQTNAILASRKKAADLKSLEDML